MLWCMWIVFSLYFLDLVDQWSENSLTDTWDHVYLHFNFERVTFWSCILLELTSALSSWLWKLHQQSSYQYKREIYNLESQFETWWDCSAVECEHLWYFIEVMFIYLVKILKWWWQILFFITELKFVNIFKFIQSRQYKVWTATECSEFYIS